MKRFLSVLISFLLIFSLSACTNDGSSEGTIDIAVTTYPLYLFATAITEGTDNVKVQLIVNQSTSCLHDYTLTVRDMKIIEGADAIILNGAGFESFLHNALSSAKVPSLDCSEGLDLLTAQHSHHDDHDDHDDHSHDETDSFDPHYWLGSEGPYHALRRISDFISSLDPSNTQAYEANLSTAFSALDSLAARRTAFTQLPQTDIITFHDGFRYLAESCGLTILKSIEEEEGSEASAQELVNLISIINSYNLPAIFTEINGSESAARILTHETGTQAYPLTMIMSGNGRGLQPYIDAMNNNYDTLLAALGG